MSTSTSRPPTRSATWTERLRARAPVALVLALAAAGCGAPLVSHVRFENRAPVMAIDDRRPIACPAPRPRTENATGLRDVRAAFLFGTSAPRPRARARGVNSLGEVPDSSWFENRIGVREIAVDELVRGPGDGRGPVAPFVVLGSKRGGRALGLTVEDALGDRYLLKFDHRDAPEVETANDVITSRLLWATGYHVPEDTLVFVSRADLVLGEDAELELVTGHERPMTPDDVDALLVQAASTPDGRSFRALASAFLEGVPIGGYPAIGVRRDDPNDRIPHELRRDVRGQRLVFAWLGHTDVKEANTLDTWVETEEGAGRGYVVHHLVDFGLSLGAKAPYDLRPHDGYAYDADFKWAFGSLFTLGLLPRPWDDDPAPDLPGVGRYDAAHFDPTRFRPTRPYVPFLFTDRLDAYWAAKIIARFRPEHVEAVVAEARFGDPRSARHVAGAILGRRRALAAHWFGEVSPIDHFRVDRAGDGWRVCAVDLLLQYGLGRARDSRYQIDSFDYHEAPLGGARVVSARDDGAVCVDVPPARGRRDRYTMVRFRVLRGDRELPPVIAHFADEPRSDRPWLIGVDRR